MRLDGRVGIVTGGGSGFGRATVLRFVEEGAAVVIGELDAAAGQRVVDEVRAGGGRAELVEGDVSQAGTSAALVERAMSAFGGLDVLVNNAGIAQDEPRDTWNMSEDNWDRVIRVNLRSVYVCSRAAIPVMIEQRRGSIVSVASIAATRPVGGAAYAATKGGVISYTRLVSRELAGRGIRVNCVSPGFMRTPMTTGERMGLSEPEQEERLRGFGRIVPMRSVGEAVDIADAVVFLASDEAKYITGQEIVVDGGYLAG